MIVKCPHCDREIDLLSQGDIKSEYGLGPNVVAKAERSGVLEPWLRIPNRFLYLREKVLDYVVSRDMGEIEKLAGPMGDRLSRMPRDRQEQVLRALQARLGDADKA